MRAIPRVAPGGAKKRGRERERERKSSIKKRAKRARPVTCPGEATNTISIIIAGFYSRGAYDCIFHAANARPKNLPERFLGRGRGEEGTRKRRPNSRIAQVVPIWLRIFFLPNTTYSLSVPLALIALFVSIGALLMSVVQSLPPRPPLDTSYKEIEKERERDESLNKVRAHRAYSRCKS